jgi:predicted transcriptional regulator
MINEVEIYRAYIEAKADPKKTVTAVAEQFNITRAGLYEIVKRIEKGNVSKIRTCTEKSRLDCLWEYKYKTRFEAIPKDRKDSSIVALKSLIKDMHKDNFTTLRISVQIGKDRSTILHHIEN